MEEILTEDKTQDDVSFDALLDDFLNNELSGVEEYQPKPAAKPEEVQVVENQAEQEAAPIADPIFTEAGSTPSFAVTDSLENLGAGERELMKAYNNFLESVYTISGIDGVEPPDFTLTASMMIPNYRPAIGQILSEDVLQGWDLLLHLHYEELKDLDMKSSDDGFLNYAEKLSNPNLQFAIVSYVEILIELESCELNYEDKKMRARRRKIEKEFFEEQKRKNERKKRFIEAVAAKNFPIDADRLVTNYLKTANKDPKGAFEALTENPAIYAPIQNDKIKPRLFGLIKKSSKDGIRMNKIIGKFMKKLKV